MSRATRSSAACSTKPFGTQSDDHSPRNGTGITWSLPKDDRHNRTKRVDRADHDVAGRTPLEEIKFGDVTNGASNDFEKASELARRMVTQFGMSELGPITYGRGAHQVFLGRDIGEERN